MFPSTWYIPLKSTTKSKNKTFRGIDLRLILNNIGLRFWKGGKYIRYVWYSSSQYVPMIGFSMVIIADVSIFIPWAPPGKNVIKYQTSESNWNADEATTIIYPDNPWDLKVKYIVASMDPMYITVKGNLSEANIPEKWACGPRRIAKLPMKVSDPHVKQSANFRGRTAMRGKPTVNPSVKKTTDNIRRAQNIYFQSNKNKHTIATNIGKFKCERIKMKLL